MKIEKATIVSTRHGADTIILWTDFPSAMPKVTEQNLAVTFNAEKDTGEEYVRKHFPSIEINKVPAT